MFSNYWWYFLLLVFIIIFLLFEGLIGLFTKMNLSVLFEVFRVIFIVYGFILTIFMNIFTMNSRLLPWDYNSNSFSAKNSPILEPYFYTPNFPYPISYHYPQLSPSTPYSNPAVTSIPNWLPQYIDEVPPIMFPFGSWKLTFNL